MTLGARFRALVVDEGPPLVQVISGYLAREGFDVVTADDGESAVATARDPTMGYCLDAAAWGQGYATEAVCALLQWAFDTLDLTQV